VIVEFTSAIGGLKTAVELVRGVAAADRALNEADLKLKLLGAVNEMVTAQMALVDARQAVEERDAEVERLKEALAIKGNVVLVNSAYYLVDEVTGRGAGHWFCMRCYEVENRLRHLAYGRTMMGDPVTCPSCSAKYVYAGVYPIE
jgi:rubrerythrin